VKRLVRGVASEERLVLRCSVAEDVWQICVAQQGGEGPVFLRLHVLNALAIAFGKRQHRICEVKGRKRLCTNPTCSSQFTASMPEESPYTWAAAGELCSAPQVWQSWRVAVASARACYGVNGARLATAVAIDA
jgi:hypothetical protein